MYRGCLCDANTAWIFRNWPFWILHPKPTEIESLQLSVLGVIALEHGMEHISRATRFPIRLPLYYRCNGLASWRRGRSLNISRTGILFEAEEDLPMQAAAEVRIELPHASGAILACCGPIIRKQAPPSLQSPASFAAVIRSCSLGRDPGYRTQGPPRTAVSGLI
jgi:hypothetical protein